MRALFAPLGESAKGVGDAYADCLAGVRGGVDVNAGHDRCRRSALTALESQAGLHGDALDAFDRSLQALEAEISYAT